MAALSKAVAAKDKDRRWQEIPRTPKAILRHALRGALRAASVAYGTRAVLGLLLRLMSVLKDRDTLRHAFYVAFKGTDTLRFSAFFGLFAFIWKLVSHSLREIRGADDRWNDFIGGFLGGVALLAESPERRMTYAQQFFVRGLQSAYASLHTRNLISIPYGGALLFMVAGSQVMYAYMMKPATIPPDFYRFMVKAARVPDPVLRYNAENVLHGRIDPSKAVEFVQRYRGTAENLALAAQMTAQPGPLPCGVIHPTHNHCAVAGVDLWARVFLMIAPVYASLNLAPMVTLRWKQFLADPWAMLRKALLNTVRSSCFLATYVGCFMPMICSHRAVHRTVQRATGYNMADSKWLVYLFGWLNGLAIFIEHPARRVELGLYVLPKAAESFFRVLLQRRLAVVIPHADLGMFAIAMGIIMSFYQREPEHLTPMMRRLMRPFFGRF